MRASVFCGVSLDGYIARKDGGLDWLKDDAPPEDNGYNEFIATVDALVIGRNTFEVVLGFGGWVYGKLPVFVLSSRDLGSIPPGAVVERRSGEPAEIWADLDSRGFEHLYIDGGITIQRFLDAGLIDTLTVTLLPILIGEGIPLFGKTSRDIRLKLDQTREFANGMVQCTYSVKK